MACETASSPGLGHSACPPAALALTLCRWQDLLPPRHVVSQRKPVPTGATGASAGILLYMSLVDLIAIDFFSARMRAAGAKVQLESRFRDFLAPDPCWHIAGQSQHGWCTSLRTASNESGLRCSIYAVRSSLVHINGSIRRGGWLCC
jgi:hypothetical protein